MAIEGPKPARGLEIRSAAELGHRVFSPNAPWRRGDRFPDPPPDAVRENLRVFTDDGKVVSAVTMNYREVILLGTRHLVCTFGGVCTEPDYRGRGLATRLLGDAREKAVAEGADLVLISGRRGLYRHQGYVQVGDFHVCTVRHSALPPGPVGSSPEGSRYLLRAVTADDLPALMEVYTKEPVRFVRTPEELLRLVSGTRLLMGHGETQVICRADDPKPIAYVACQIGGTHWEHLPPNAIRIIEIAGCRRAIVQSLAALLDQRGTDSLELHYAGWDAEIAAAARDYGWPSEPRTFRGTVGIIEPARFWNASTALFRERLGAERLERLSFSADGAANIRCGAEELVLEDMTALTRLVFEHPAHRGELPLGLPPGSELAQALADLFPMPLVNYGLNYF